jgi:hypothetical protein
MLPGRFLLISQGGCDIFSSHRSRPEACSFQFINRFSSSSGELEMPSHCSRKRAD